MTETPQHLEALDRANEVRLARAELKREIKSGARSVADLIHPANPLPDFAEAMSVDQLLKAQRRWGTTRARSFLRGLGIGEKRLLSQLTTRQRWVIARKLDRTSPLPPSEQLAAA